MNVLFIGGTGKISSACTRDAVNRGIDLSLLNRGLTTRPVPEGVEVIRGDSRDKAGMSDLLRTRTFDVVVNWIAFTPEHVQNDIDLFQGRVKQYIFISSASVYQTPPASLPITESTPLCNPFWRYSQDKIACENLLISAYRESGFPATIVRPSHTYDRTMLIMTGGYTAYQRIKSGRPVIVHGDGTSLWTLTHHRDFAQGFTGLLGLPQMIGEAVHITSDEVLTWNQIYDFFADAAGTVAHKLHVPSALIAKFDPETGAGLLGDKAHSMIFDNSKIKRVVPGYKATIPFAHGVKEIVRWVESGQGDYQIDSHYDQLCDQLVQAVESISID